MENKYFDAAVSIADYEAKTGRKASDYLAEMTRMMEPIINKAYMDGYTDGVKAATSEGITHKQT